MQKNAYFTGLTVPLLLLLPQLAITVLFFYWPASQAVWQSFLLQDAFGTSTEFVWFENYQTLFSDPGYLKAFINTAIFSSFVCVLSLSIALLFAVMADRQIRGAEVYKTLLIWPYAVAPAVAGVLWLFMFDPSLGMLARGLSNMGIAWNPRLNGNDAMLLVILAATWKQISYNFLFFLAGLQSIPKSVIEAAVIDGARPMRRFWTIIFPLLSPTTFFLLVVNIVGIFDTITGGGPSGATETLVYKVFSDGKGGSNLGGSAAQSVVLLVMVIGMTAVQFKFIERKVNY